MAPWSRLAPTMVGRMRAPNPGRTYQVRTGTGLAASSTDSGYAVDMPRSLRSGFVALAILAAVAGCNSGAAVTSFDPTTPCTADGRFPGAYPDLEAQVPKSYMSAAPETLDSGRNCTTANLGSLAGKGITMVRFAGGTWTFGAERAAVLARFTADGLDATSLADFYERSAKAASRTNITNETTPTVAGRPGYRLDTETGQRTQTVVVWPSAIAGIVNVVITDDLPDARIQDAIDAFGGH